MKKFLLVAGLLLLFAAEISRVYLIMPFPGSQHNDTLPFAYWLNKNLVWIRIFLLLVIAYPVAFTFNHSKLWKKILLSCILIIYGVIFYFVNFRFQADKIFYQPRNKSFAGAADSKISGDKLVIGVVINGEAKAYPIQLIGYHHQVRDTIGNTPVMVTYCTVCRTGRVFSPFVGGKIETFRLVGMDHFNAMFEDATTKSWWRQETGVAAAGPLTGTSLAEIPSRQATLDSWLQQYPNSLILQPDTIFKKRYENLADFDKGTIDGDLEKRDSASWKFKSWIVGIAHGNDARAYDWNELVDKKLLQDSLPGLPLVIALEKDTATFHAWSRMVKGNQLQFVKDNQSDLMKDKETQSTWNMSGLCVDGPLKGEQLIRIQAYQEFWHSWKSFHPNTTQYKFR
jgi:hypothetical protein